MNSPVTVLAGLRYLFVVTIVTFVTYMFGVIIVSRVTYLFVTIVASVTTYLFVTLWCFFGVHGMAIHQSLVGIGAGALGGDVHIVFLKRRPPILLGPSDMRRDVRRSILLAKVSRDDACVHPEVNPFGENHQRSAVVQQRVFMGVSFFGRQTINLWDLVFQRRLCLWRRSISHGAVRPRGDVRS